MIRIEAPNVEVEFEKGSVLRGSPAGTLPDQYEGVGIRIDGQAGVTVRGAVVSGFRCAVWASKADGLTLQGADASDNRRAHLRSTPAAEDGADWLFPHNNEDRNWLKQYAAALYVDNTARATISRCRVRHGQNALCLDRVTQSKIYDNDLSFNSGWGIAMWRCTHNVISRNAVDFCVRGYSHMVYNRGQDSAGILMFEQDCNNVVAENSVTHGGDGIFGFAGREAIGDAVKHDQDWYRRRGCNDNLFLGNDLSYAPAHGLEMTFSFGNQILNNRFAGNAICGLGATRSRRPSRATRLRATARGLRAGARRDQHRARTGQPHRPQHVHRRPLRRAPVVERRRLPPQTLGPGQPARLHRQPHRRQHLHRRAGRLPLPRP